MGFEPVLLPLTEIRPLAMPALPSLDSIGGLVFTSANGVRHAPADLAAAFAAGPVFAVGDETALAANAAGFSDVRSADGSARELASLIAGSPLRAGRLLHLAGRERTANFAELLAAKGVDLVVAEVYSAEPVDYPDARLETLLGRQPLFAALVHSPRAGRLLASLSGRAMMDIALSGANILCISANAAEPLAATGRVFVSAAPREDALLALLSATD